MALVSPSMELGDIPSHGENDVCMHVMCNSVIYTLAPLASVCVLAIPYKGQKSDLQYTTGRVLETVVPLDPNAKVLTKRERVWAMIKSTEGIALFCVLMYFVLGAIFFTYVTVGGRREGGGDGEE